MLFCVRWREPEEEIRSSSVVLEPTFIHTTAKEGRGRIWILSSNGWSYTSLQRRCLHRHNFNVEMQNAK
ncbi:hypothetical protein LINPERHAP1_LOCUS341 [Linum perenne]